MKTNRVLFLNLTAFSKTGGIEKFNKCLLKALSEFEQNTDLKVQSYSLHDHEASELYFQKKSYKGFSGKRIQFVWKSILKAKDFDQIIIGHINIAIIGYLIKFFFPKKRLILVTHGIEVWQPLTGIKKVMLHKSDIILTVSQFTKRKLIEFQNISGEKISLFYNAIDPFFSYPTSFQPNNNLRLRYQLKADDFVLFTLTRLSSAEKYKGYDMVIQCLPGLLKKIPTIKYVIAGKYDKHEKERIDQLIKNLELEEVVLLPGFLKDEEIPGHFQMGDVFIMPSQGEGFGIVFIEAMVCGSFVIAGNADGSVDALQNGELGTLVNPSSEQEISKAIYKQFLNRSNFTSEEKRQLQQKTLGYFDFNQYKKRLENIVLQY